MGNVTIGSVAANQLVMMADGLLRGGDAGLAKQLYQLALKRAKAADRAPIRTRIGLTSANPKRRGVLLDVLEQLERASFPNAFVGEGIATWFKTLPFAEDARFQELAEKHAGLLPIPNWQWNLQVALWAVREALALPGDLVELGVFRGHTTLFCAEYTNFAAAPKRWWLYDTFDGIPDDQLDPGWAGMNKAAYGGTFSHEEVVERFAHIPNIAVIRGRVPEILHETSPQAIAFIHMDLNNATAEIAALDLLYGRLCPGGIILFDDYCWLSSRAQHAAEKAWFEKRGLQILPLPTGQGLYVKR